MNPNCFRCGRSAFATITVEAAIGATRLKISGHARETGICAPCMIGLADWLKRGQELECTGFEETVAGLAGETAGAVGSIAP